MKINQFSIEISRSPAFDLYRFSIPPNGDAFSLTLSNSKMTVILKPAGKLQKFFVTMSRPGHEQTPEEAAKIFAENYRQAVGPPLKPE